MKTLLTFVVLGVLVVCVGGCDRIANPVQTVNNISGEGQGTVDGNGMSLGDVDVLRGEIKGLLAEIKALQCMEEGITTISDIEDLKVCLGGENRVAFGLIDGEGNSFYLYGGDLLDDRDVVTYHGLLAIGIPDAGRGIVDIYRTVPGISPVYLETLHPRHEGTVGYGNDISFLYSNGGWWLNIYSTDGEATAMRIDRFLTDVVVE